MQIIKANIDTVKPWPKNPRQIKKQDFERLKNQIKKLGLYKPLVAYKEKDKYIVLGGNMRLAALKSLDYKEVDISVITPKTEAEKLEYSLSDNDRAGEYVEDNLMELLHESKDELKLEDYNIDLGTADNAKDMLDDFLNDGETKEDETPEPPMVPKTKPGDLYILGNHRLLCGDSTKKEDVERLMAGQKADMVFTDPPYGVNYQDVKHNHKKIANDKGVDIAHLLSGLTFDCPTFVCCNWQSYNEFYGAIKDVKSVIVWDKEVRIQNLDKFFKQHEFIMYSGVFGGQKTVDGDVWRIARETRSDHPTAKPIELCGRAINSSSSEGMNVIDLFGGSGSTLVACEQLNRKCYMMELDPVYCDVIVKRWENASGKTAEIQK